VGRTAAARVTTGPRVAPGTRRGQLAQVSGDGRTCGDARQERQGRDDRLDLQRNLLRQMPLSGEAGWVLWFPSPRLDFQGRQRQLGAKTCGKLVSFGASRVPRARIKLLRRGKTRLLPALSVFSGATRPSRSSARSAERQACEAEHASRRAGRLRPVEHEMRAAVEQPVGDEPPAGGVPQDRPDR
jgi:hypothetical protein